MNHLLKNIILSILLCPGASLVAAETSLSSLPLDQVQVGWGKPLANQSIDGNPLKVGGKVYDKGLGLHPPGWLALQLDGQATKFRCLAALDDETGGKGTVELKFYGSNWRLLQASGILRGGQPAVPIEIDLTGQKSLVIEITVGGDNYTLDHIDLLDPVIVHNGTPPVMIALPPGREVADEMAAIASGKDERLAQLIRDRQKQSPKQAAAGEKQLQELAAIKQALNDPKTAAAAVDKYLALRRQVMLACPLLGFKDILFVKRDVNPPNEKQGNHMCDQYFGFHAQTEGTGLFILKNAFAEKPQVRNVLEKSVCANGRFAGKPLPKGGYLSPELSYDGKTILFAFTEADRPQPDGNLDLRYKWIERSTWHIFKVNVDGTNLIQLTDGGFNDFDPCWLPNGRILFISERRGAYQHLGANEPLDFGRCHGRPVPTFTLHAMEADGSGITTLSWHETNEWQPSVDNDGMVIYTRWDYVDRGFNQAHHPWITTPDGRNPRVITGNYRDKEADAPCMEMNLRAIPGSKKLVATAAAHHGQAYGSLIMIDPNIADDYKLAQIKTLTPDARFPESTCSNNDDWKYATAWPLSEEWFLCVHDPQGCAGRGPQNRFRLTLLHAPTGLKETLYLDPDHSCLDPIPMRARPVPPIIPEASEAFANAKTRAKVAYFGISNIYESYLPFPKEVKIKELRIFQVIPKTTPIADAPMIGWGSQKPARGVLGTVPVEADGSVYFELPAQIPVFFQAIDENGLAWQSMRSSTYAQPGERLTCIGCHEPRNSAPPSKPGIAFKRAPSKIQPEVAGSRPFSYPILVQPVLDKNCVDCHQKNADKKAPDLSKGNYDKNPHNWYTSYISLRQDSFHYDDPRFESARTVPGKFGARGSKLYQMLAKGHHEVKLTPEGMHRITLWLDCNSDFFGAFENTKDQADGKVVKPKLE
jgi:hypothetical protein